MPTENELGRLLSQFTTPGWNWIDSSSLESLGNHGGFSGSDLYRFESEAGPMLIRRYPEITRQYADRIRWIHQVISHAAKLGCGFLAVPQPDDHGNSLCRLGNRYWQIENWIEGEANFWQNPSEGKYQQIFAALARFHQSTAQLQMIRGPSPSIASRLERMKQLEAITPDRIASRHRQLPTPFQQSILDLALEACRLFHLHRDWVRRQLIRWVEVPFDLVPCFRDVWHDHLIFLGDRLNGIVDYGAVNIDNIATDISRLSVSLTRDNPSGFRKAFDTYGEYAKMGQSEILLGIALNHSNILMSSMNWIDWIFFDQRRFESVEPIRDRISRNIMHLQILEKTEQKDIK